MRNKAPTTDRLPPYAIESEQGAVGSLLLNPNEALAEFTAEFTKGSDVMYDFRHQDIVDALIDMFNAGKHIDVITVSQCLKDRGELDGVGGTQYLCELIDCSPSASNLSYYLPTLREKAICRKVLRCCAETTVQIYENERDAEGMLDSFERDVLAIRPSKHSRDAAVGAKASVGLAIDQIEKMHQRQGALSGLATGFVDFDKMTGGLQDGELIVLAARPSLGKTSLSMNVAEHVAVNLNVPVGVFSMEMKVTSLMVRMICSRSRVNGRDVAQGFLEERDFPKLTIAAGRISASPLWIDDTSVLSIMQLRARARRMVQQHGIRFFIVDYLQLMSSPDRRNGNREQEVSEISRGLKSLAKELNLPVLALSQLNRDMEREKNRKPKLSDLRESGSLEQDADVVALLYRPKKEEDDSNGHADAEPINMVVAKSRSGPTGEIQLTFLKSYTRFESASHVETPELPQHYTQ